jgi:hypothetical protein
MNPRSIGLIGMQLSWTFGSLANQTLGGWDSLDQWYAKP